MKRSSLASRLIAAGDDTERRRLVSANAGNNFETLAEDIRRICFDAWATEPVTARQAASALRVLDQIASDPAVSAIAAWVTGIAEVTRGSFAPAIAALDRAVEIWTSLGREGQKAQTQVSLLLALAMRGQYDRAIETGNEALRTFIACDDQLAAGKIEMNLSNVVSRRGEHHDAERYCASARRRFIKAGETEWQAMAENGLANTYAELNRFDQAEEYYGHALSTASNAGMHVTEAEIEASMGNLALFRGRYGEALRHLESSHRRYERLEMPHQSAIAELEIADIYAELNLNTDALEIYERVAGEFRRLRMRAEEARSRLNLARSAVSDGDLALAAGETGKALRLYRSEKNLSGEGAARLMRARVALGRRNYAMAARSAMAAADLLRRSHNSRNELDACLVAGDALSLRGAHAAARTTIEGVRRRSVRLGLPELEQRALTALGRLARSSGNGARAERYYQQAVAIVERLRAPLASEEFSMSYLAARLAPFDGLTRLYLDSGRSAEAFAAAESGRSRALLDAIAGGPAANTDDELLPQVRRTREELNNYYKRLERSDADEIAGLQAEITSREDLLARLSKRIASSAMPHRAHGTTAARVDLSALFESLGDERTLIEYIEIDGRLSAFVLTGGEIRYIADLASTDDVLKALEGLRFQFGSLRYGSPGIERFQTQLKANTDRQLKRLYDLIYAPLARYVSGNAVVIVPTGALHYVPFPALSDGERYLIEQVEISHAPSASVWHRLHEMPVREVRSSLLIGYADEQAPEVESEVLRLSSMVPAPLTLTGDAASFSAFAANAPQHDLVHLACHGHFRAESPMFSSLHLADGWVTVRDICNERIDAALVTLSACETGLNALHAGDEVLGLSRAFLSAGAASLIVSLWSVNDVATRDLMSALYDGMQRELGPAASLRKAQIASITNGAHPMYWAPFIYIGG